LKQLLFVDDEVKVLDGLRRMLRAKREVWECHYATGVDEALSVVSTVHLDAVVSDVNMPGKNGLDLLRVLRSSDASKFLPVLMLTGNGDVSTKRDALELGATDFLNKPFDFIELTARLQNAIAMKGFQDEIRAHNAILEKKVTARTVELERSRRDIILRLAKAAETRDVDTGNHIVRVGVVAQMLAEALGFDQAFQKKILLTAPLHDVGKIGVSDGILQKNGPLSSEERLKMQEHCQIGADILTEDLGPVFRHFDEPDDPGHENELLRMAARIAQCHHERWDGAGYPDGLIGEAIPIEGRIVAVADVYDALRSRRVYKPKFGPAETLQLIVDGAGTQFDPVVVAKFAELFEEIESAVENLREKDIFDLAA
jgi:response regulator RpfG family c-di-GMP phosphodiesterase